MADLYTPSDEILKRIAANRSAETAAARATLAGPIPPPPLPPTAPAATVAPPAQGASQPGRLSRAGNYDVGAAAKNVAGKIGGAAGIVASPLALTGGALQGGYQSLADNSTGYRDQFANSVGAGDGILSNLAADTARTAEAVGNGVTFGLAGRLGRGISEATNGGSFLNGFTGDSARDQFLAKQVAPTGPISAAATKANPVQERVAGVIEKMNGGPAAGLNGVTQQPTSVNGITQLTGGQFKSPMLTDDPARAASEYGSKKNSLFSVVPNTVEADKSYLQGAFLKHINSGDLDRAAATAVSPQDQAALGIAYNQRQQAQAQAAQTEPLQRMLMESLEKANKPQGGGIRDFAFGGPMRGRGGAAQGDSSQGTAGIISQLLAAQKGGQPQQSPMAQALAQTAGQQAADTNIEGQKIAQQGAKITQGGLLHLQSLNTQLSKETDPTKREKLQEEIQAASGRYQKAAPADKFVVVDGPDGPPDMMGQTKPTKVAMNTATGEMLNGRAKAAAAPPSKAEVIKNAQAALAAGRIKKEAIIADSLAKYGFDPFK